MIAADVNNDNQITAIDLLELRKLILGIYTAFPNNTSWNFVKPEDELNLTNPWVYNSTRLIEDLQSTELNENFIGVKVGDVNGSVVANFKDKSFESRKDNAIEFKYEDAFVEKGERFTVGLNASRNDIYGYQFTMDLSDFVLEDVKGGNIDESNIGVFENKMTVSYNSIEPFGGDILILTFMAINKGNISDFISINSDITKAEAYVGDNLEIVDIQIKDVVSNEFSLLQNEPNPFNEYTYINFELPNKGNALISFFDVNGILIKEIDGNYEKGLNKVKVTKDELGISGMVYYQLQFDEESQTKHMIVID